MRLLSALENPHHYNFKNKYWNLDSLKTGGYSNDWYADKQLPSILRSCQDLSSLSTELQNQVNSWYSAYYLSAQRSFLLRAFDWSSQKTALELGSGCGSISRFLGETFDQVLSIEGNPSRANITSMRLNDIDSAQVLNAPIEALNFKIAPDFIFCIGVLEYAPQIISTKEDPIEYLLNKMSGWMNENTVLVLAIENQLGLKYFNSHPEDHTSIPYDGIEGYHRSAPSSPQTLGKQELRKYIYKSGIENCDFYYPFPDYKMTKCVATEQALLRPSLAQILSVAPSEDTFGREKELFSENLTREVLIKNKLLSDMSNSFLVFASNSDKALEALKPKWDAVSFSINDRKPEYWTRTSFQANNVKKERLKDDLNSNSKHLQFSSYEEEYYSGQLLGYEVEKLFQKKHKILENDLPTLLKPWSDYLHQYSQKGHLPGRFIDANPRNFIYNRETEKVYFFDREFSWRTSLPLDLIIAKGCYSILEPAVKKPGSLRAYKGKNIAYLLIELMHQLGFEDFNHKDLYRLAKLNTKFHQEVSGNQEPTYKRFIAFYVDRVPFRQRTYNIERLVYLPKLSKNIYIALRNEKHKFKQRKK